VAPDDALRQAPTHLDELIRDARGGSREALGRLLESYRPYLLLVANQEVNADLRAKVGPSDLVQDSFLEAQQDFAEFRGCSHAELAGWLRGILLHNLANQNRKFFATQRRQLQREVALDAGPLEGGRGGRDVISAQRTPRALAVAHEEVELLAAALARVPELYQRIIRLRHEEHSSFAEIGQLLGRSAEAARKLWFRAVELLRQELGQRHAE
jgi:RNA polymerase sigma-70 factor (ECF subfamily)